MKAKTKESSCSPCLVPASEMRKEVIGNKLYKFDAGFFSSGKATGSVDTGGSNGF
jgi:hypothetical protein